MVDRNIFMELNRIICIALYRTFSASHSIEFTVNDSKIFYGLIPLSFTVCKHINYVFFKSVCMKSFISREFLNFTLGLS